MSKEMTIIVDTREKKPLVFSGFKIRSMALKTGDYSAVGYDTKVCVEYKSLGDFFMWINPFNAKRFNGQMDKLIATDYSCVVVGGKLNSHSKFSFIKLPTILERVAILSSHNIPIIFAGSRAVASKMVVAFLQQGIKRVREDLDTIL